MGNAQSINLSDQAIRQPPNQWKHFANVLVFNIEMIKLANQLTHLHTVHPVGSVTIWTGPDGISLNPDLCIPVDLCK